MHYVLRVLMTVNDERSLWDALSLVRPGLRLAEADPRESNEPLVVHEQIRACRSAALVFWDPSIIAELPSVALADGRVGLPAQGPFVVLERSLIRNGRQLYTGKITAVLPDDDPTATAFALLLADFRGVIDEQGSVGLVRADAEFGAPVGEQEPDMQVWPDALGWSSVHRQRVFKDRRAPRYYLPIRE